MFHCDSECIHHHFISIQCVMHTIPLLYILTQAPITCESEPENSRQFIPCHINRIPDPRLPSVLIPNCSVIAVSDTDALSCPLSNTCAPSIPYHLTPSTHSRTCSRFPVSLVLCTAICFTPDCPVCFRLSAAASFLWLQEQRPS